MSRSSNIFLVATVALTFFRPAPGSAQGDLHAYNSYLQSAASLEAQRQIDVAGELYARAVGAAPSRTERVEAWLAWAGLLSRNPGSGEVARQRASKAEALYTSALSQGEGDLKLKTHNDFGVFLLRHGLVDKAATVLAQIEDASWSGPDGPSLRARYLYNYGQALERSHHPADAYSRYLEAIRLDPEFELTREAANRLANQPSPPNGRPFPDPTLPLTKALLTQNRLPEAGSSLLRLASQPDRLRTENPEGFVDLLVQYLTNAQVDPEQFDRRWKASVVNLQGALPSPATERLEEIRNGYTAALGVEFHPGAATATFKAWSDADRVRPFSNFLKMVGDAYASRGNLRSSLERYSQAVSLDPTNSAAALFLTNLLVEYSSQLDPQGTLLYQWTEQSRGAEEKTHSPSDLKHYVHLHSLLGTHFEREKVWGPEANPQTALFQWRQAVQTQEKIAAIDPGEVAPKASLYEHLGSTYEALGYKAQAAREYRTAAMAYAGQNNPGKTNYVLSRVAELERDVLDPQLAMQDRSSTQNDFSTRFHPASGAERLASTVAMAQEPSTSESSFNGNSREMNTTTSCATAGSFTNSTFGVYGTVASTGSGVYGDTSSSSDLPATASLRPILGMLGMLFLAMSLIVHFWRKSSGSPREPGNAGLP
jgi:tetratricopeptide (TPR) repeat protein